MSEAVDAAAVGVAVQSTSRVPWPVVAVFGLFAVLAAAAVWHDLFYFSDGAWFAFAIATGSGWDLFWSDWPRRLGALLLCGGPAWLLQAAGGTPWLVGKAYQVGFYAVPFYGLLLLQWMVPQQVAGRWLKWLTVSFVILGLGTFAFGTESWIALPLFWPVLAAISHPPRDWPRQVVAIAVGALFLFTHELAVLTVPALALALHRSWREHAGDACIRAFLARFTASALLLGLAWAFLLFTFHPDNTLVELALQANQGSIWAPWFLRRPLVFACALLAGFALLVWWRPGWAARRGLQAGIVAVAACAAVVCYFLDVPDDRYLQRSLITWALPVMGLAAVLLPRAPGWKPLAWVLVPALSLQLLVHAHSLVLWEDYRTLLLEQAPADGRMSYREWSAQVRQKIPRSAGYLWDWAAPYVSVMLSLPSARPPALVASGGWYVPLTCIHASAVLPRVAWLAPETREALVRDACAKNH